MEFIANKECICKKTMLTKGNKRSKSLGVLNPAFEDFDLSELHFPECVSTSYLKADTISEEGFDSFQNYVTNSCPNSPFETRIGIEIETETSSGLNSMRATPLKKFKDYNKSNFSKYCVLILVWVVVVFSFAGIFASVAAIIWLETYSEGIKTKNLRIYI
jgi:hypothetical protein